MAFDYEVLDYLAAVIAFISSSAGWANIAFGRIKNEVLGESTSVRRL
jgi:hypothetical protein